MQPTDVSPLYRLLGPFNIKINGLEMAQNLIGPPAWALAIVQNKPSVVIEIGTSKGGLSSLISGCVSQYGGEFHTFDIHGDGDYNQYTLHGRSYFHLLNCFSIEGQHMIEHLIKSSIGKCFVLCDGGNKPKEFNTFSKHLKIGDVVAAHDFIDETIPNFSPLYWSCYETHLECLDLSGMKDFMPEWFKFSAWKAVEKI